MDTTYSSNLHYLFTQRRVAVRRSERASSSQNRCPVAAREPLDLVRCSLLPLHRSTLATAATLYQRHASLAVLRKRIDIALDIALVYLLPHLLTRLVLLVKRSHFARFSPMQVFRSTSVTVLFFFLGEKSITTTITVTSFSSHQRIYTERDYSFARFVVNWNRFRYDADVTRSLIIGGKYFYQRGFSRINSPTVSLRFLLLVLESADMKKRLVHNTENH